MPLFRERLPIHLVISYARGRGQEASVIAEWDDFCYRHPLFAGYVGNFSVNGSGNLEYASTDFTSSAPNDTWVISAEVGGPALVGPNFTQSDYWSAIADLDPYTEPK